MLRDAIIVGGSAAGLTAALYAARQGLKTLVITKDIGGQMLLTNEIQNYPGIRQTTGFDLANGLKEQAEMYGAEFVFDEVVEIVEDRECPGLCYTVRTTTDEFHATAIILAFGKTPRDLGVQGEQKFKGRGVSYCAVCDGPLFRGKAVAVVGSGDQALEAVNYLSNVVSRVYLVHNYNDPIGSEEIVRQVRGIPNVTLVPNSRVVRLEGETKLEKVIVSDTRNNLEQELSVDGIFVEIGYLAKTEFLVGLVKINSRREVEVDSEGSTSTLGIFAGGDVTNAPYKQAVISASQGAIAALSAYNYIQRLRGKTAAKADWRTIKPLVRG